MYKIVYIVNTDSGEAIEFDSANEAIDFAEENNALEVKAIDCELNDFGEVVAVNDEEVIWAREEESDEELVSCSWCGEDWPVSDCRQEANLGWLCPQCQAAIKSRGEQLIFIEDLDEYYEGCCRDVDPESSVKPAKNAVVDCEVNPVIAHSEDEKPLDCKMEKAPLEKPLTEEEEFDAAADEFDDLFTENVNVNVSADRPEELAQLWKAFLGSDWDVFDQDFEEPAEIIPAAELEAGFDVTPEPEISDDDYVDPFEENPFDEAPEEEAGAEEISDEEESEDPIEPADEDSDTEADDEEVELTDDEKEMEKNAESRPADEQPMDMIDGKLVPAKDPKEAEVEIDDEEVDECLKKKGLTEALKPDVEQLIADIFAKNQGAEEDPSNVILDDYYDDYYNDGYDCYVVECDNSNPTYLTWLRDDLRNKLEPLGVGFDTESNGNGSYGRTYIFYEYDTENVDESLNINEDVEESLEDTVDLDLADNRQPEAEVPAELDLEHQVNGNEMRTHEAGILAEEGDFDDFDTQINPEELDSTNYDGEQELQAGLKSWICYFDGEELGEVLAWDEEDAYSEMETT